MPRKLTNDQARELRKMSREGYSTRELGKHFGISSRTAHAIIQGVTYRDA